jgi:hypothetical protein
MRLKGMSGGFFEYKNHALDEIVEQLEQVALDFDYHGIKDEHIKATIERVRKDAVVLAVFLERIDYLLSGDDGEDDFKRRLEEDLNKAWRELV